MQKITPCLWFDDDAEEAVDFYTSIFNDSKVKQKEHYGKAGSEASGMPEGSVMTIVFEMEGFEFMALNGGPTFKVNPSISFHVKCRTMKEVDDLWNKLSKDGKALMELGEYPFSKRYGWVQDKYGISWQVIHTEDDFDQRFVPALLFAGDVCGKAEEAIKFYESIFSGSSSNVLARYTGDEGPDEEGTVMYAQFILEGQEFGAMDSAHEHGFSFNEAISFIVNCEDQDEIDYYWESLSAVPEAEVCGWLKDKYGVSWQIVPTIMSEMAKDPAKNDNVMKAMIQMKKLDIEGLKKAYEGD